MVSSKVFYTADYVAELLTISRPTAYRIIRKLNDELAGKGFIIISGRVPKKYFDE